MHGMLAHNADDMDAYPNRPDGKKKKQAPIEQTAEMDGSGAKIQVQLPAE